MSRPIPPHGTTARYHGRKGLPGCRCRHCTKAAVRADAGRTLDRLAGRPRTVPCERVVAHLRFLTGQGLSYQQIADASDGVSQTTVSQLCRGKRRTVKASTEASILAVQVSDCVVHVVAALGAIRRIRALYTMGHGPRAIAAESGLSRDTVTLLADGQWQTLTAARDAALRRAYDLLWKVPGSSWKAREWAQRHDWAPPLAWDDDTIDDPCAVPQTDAPAAVPDSSPDAVDRWLHGEAVVLDDTGRRRALAHLMEFTSLPAEEIGARLEMSESAVKRSWERVKARAREAGGPVPYRRMVPAAVAHLAKAA